MPRLVAKVERKFYDSLTEKGLSALEQEWRHIVANQFRVSPEEIEVFWESPLRTLNARPLCLEVVFSTGPRGLKYVNEAVIASCRDELLQAMQNSQYLKRVITGVWMRPFNAHNVNCYAETNRFTITFDRYVVHIFDPDLGRDENGEAVWQVIVEGTIDKYLAEHGFCFMAGIKLRHLKFDLRDCLYNIVSSDVLDNGGLASIERRLGFAFDMYETRHKAAKT